jgi:hypothetical protein
VDVLEYTSANGPKTEGWKARVRKIAADHTVTTLTTFATPLPSPLPKHSIKLVSKQLRLQDNACRRLKSKALLKAPDGLSPSRPLAD